MALPTHPLVERLATLLTAVCALAVPAAAEAAAPDPTSQDARSHEDPPTRAAERPRVFFNFMLVGSMVHEDPHNRVTHRRRSAFATPGAALRVGGVVARHHLVGAILQVDWRSTQMVLDSRGNDRRWGAISSYYIGPEYRYITSFGLYAGASLGFAYTLVDNDVGGGGSPACSSYACVASHMRRTDDQGIPGVGARAVLGYELRVRRSLAVNFEAFGGVLHGDDEDHVAMTTPTYGLAVGVGF
jgi:hypothetical protein